MSKFADMLAFRQTNRRVPIIPSLQTAERAVDGTGTAYDHAIVVFLEAKFSRSASIPKHDIDRDKNGVSMDEVRRVMARAMIEEVFGEFRQPLFDAVAAARARDVATAAERIEFVLNEMFADPKVP